MGDESEEGGTPPHSLPHEVGSERSASNPAACIERVLVVIVAMLAGAVLAGVAMR